MALPPVPDRSPVTQDGSVSTGGAVKATPMSFTWLQFIRSVVSAINNAAQIVGQQLSSQNQSASIVAQTVNSNTKSGRYRITWALLIRQAATTSSSLQVAVTWTQDGVAISHGGVAITSNTLNDFESETLMVRADAGTDIVVTVNYTSVGGTPMKYDADVVVESIPEAVSTP